MVFQNKIATAFAALMLLSTGCSSVDREDLGKTLSACPASFQATGEGSTLEKLDGIFGSCAVGPLAYFMFYDVVFWDNERATPESMVGSSISGGRKLLGYDAAAQTYSAQVRAENLALDALVPASSAGEPAKGSAVEPKIGDVMFLVAADNARVNVMDIVMHKDLGKVATVQGVETTTVALGDVNRTKKNTGLAAVVLWLVFGAIFFTFKMGFINLRGFMHSVAVTKGDYDDPDDPGEISHFQALSSALSATVGLGNIAGVAVAVSAGGPGALFWMVIAGFLGMSSKFVECTLGQIYRHVDDNGVVSGGPMRYLKAGLAEKGFPRLGKVFGIIFTLMCIGGSFGGGNMFQANQAYQAVADRIPALKSDMGAVIFGVVLAALVGMVIIGGIKRIGKAASYVVPVMCAVYVLAGVAVLVLNASAVPAAFATIISEALSPSAAFGGFLGVLITGFRRAAFSNEAGVGSAAIAHSAAATEEPVREGIVAMMGPFIDTILICTMTGLVVVVTGAYQYSFADGVIMTSKAFESVFPWFPWVLSVAVLLFAFSTMISWSYYGERCFTLLFGEDKVMVYRVIFLCFVVFGSVIKLGSVLDFSDLMILGMAFPNIFGAIVLSGKVKERLTDYWGRYRSGEMKSH